jgi:hypothetical protein
MVLAGCACEVIVDATSAAIRREMRMVGYIRMDADCADFAKYAEGT